MSVTPTYDSSLSRVRLAATAAALSATVKIERRVPGGAWVVVRGGRALDATGGSVQIDDYEFAPGIVNTYRATSLSDVGVSLGVESNTITPSIDRVWLKSIARPFLNTPVEVQDYTEITRKGRAGLFSIPDRSYPVRVGDVAGARSWSTTLLTRTLVEARAVEFLVASGDVVLVQVPPAYDIPGGYVDIADLSRARFSRPLSDARRLLTLGMNEIAAPAETVVGYTSTWAGILADFGTWADVLSTFPTWADVLEYVADPSTVIVP